ncbi:MULTISPECIES: hypothetical protein [unclassified Streptomyces]|uniref:hypothetical protein n=1 Tax=unclassified Streptomyces TaxID=2593676 RepID=UPI0037FA0028
MPSTIPPDARSRPRPPGRSGAVGVGLRADPLLLPRTARRVERPATAWCRKR